MLFIRAGALAGALVASLVATVAAVAADVPKVTRDFIDTLASSNKLEIDTSELAMQHAKSNDVKTFAQTMITDHKQAASDFKSALRKANVEPPGETLSVADAAKYAKLRLFTTENGFDAAYVNMQLLAHKDAVAAFKDYATNGPTQEVKSFAMKTLPVLEHHLSMVEGLHGKVAAK
jgi:putative membrane protein